MAIHKIIVEFGKPKEAAEFTLYTGGNDPLEKELLVAAFVIASYLEMGVAFRLRVFGDFLEEDRLRIEHTVYTWVAKHLGWLPIPGTTSWAIPTSDNARAVIHDSVNHVIDAYLARCM